MPLLTPLIFSTAKILTNSTFLRAYVKLAVVITTLSMLSFADKAWSDDKDIPYCDPTAKLAPNGIIVKMSNGYYRSCMQRLEGDGRAWSQIFIEIHPATVPDLMSQYSPSVIRLKERVDGLDRLKSALRSKTLHGTRRFGDVTYESHEYVNEKSGTKPAGGVYIYRPRKNDDIPFHWVNCSGWANFKTFGNISCNLRLRNDDVVASLWFLASQDQEGDPPFADHFTGLAKEIERVVEDANVTDRLDEMKRFLDVVE